MATEELSSSDRDVSIAAKTATTRREATMVSRCASWAACVGALLWCGQLVMLCCTASQDIKLFSESDLKGFSISFNDYDDNLTRVEFNDIASSACVNGM